MSATAIATARRRPRPGRWRPSADAWIVLACLAVAAMAHRAGAALRSPYWLDESWVALASKMSVGELPTVSASSPIGWTLLVWLFPAGGQAQRLIPLTFLAASVAAAYGLGRALGWANPTTARLAGAAAAASALLTPAQQARHDLKQYTADAAIALALFALLAWTESAESAGRPASLAQPRPLDAGQRRRAALLGTAMAAGMLFSHAAALVGAAILGGVLISAALRRRWRDLTPLLPALGIAAAAMASIYLLVDRTGHGGALTSYWADYFPTLGSLPRYLADRLAHLTPALGAPWSLLLLLVAAGIAAVARAGRPATAAALALLPVVAVVAGLGRWYPLLDLRTSHFLVVVWAATAGIGVAAIATAAARLAPVRARQAVALGLVGLTVAAFAVANPGWLRPTPPGEAGEDVRAQVAYVAAHRRPGDVVLVNLSGQYGFAYYWSADQPRALRGGVQATGWHVAYPPDSRIVVAENRDAAGVADALAQAERLARAGGRIWLVRSHVIPSEALAWQSALAGRSIVLVPVGPEPVGLLTPT